MLRIKLHFQSKLTHLGLSATKFDEKVIKKLNVPNRNKIGPLGPQDPLWAPPHGHQGW